MVNLVCFPHYTCGGLLCDIFTNSNSNIGPTGGIESVEHEIGKIGDNATVYREYDVDALMERVRDLPDGSWVGTHCWPGALPHREFGRIVSVTTATYASQLMRWQRVHRFYFQETWTRLTAMELTDTMRETAKNYLIPFDPVTRENIENIEFFDVVQASAELHSVTWGYDTKTHLKKWWDNNAFLLTPRVWTDNVAQALYQAQLEVQHTRYYRYHS